MTISFNKDTVCSRTSHVLQSDNLERISSATTYLGAPNGTTKNNHFKRVKKIYEIIWVFTRYVSTDSNFIRSKFEMSIEKQKRQIKDV